MDVLTHDTAPLEELPREFGFRRAGLKNLLAHERANPLQQSGPEETEHSMGAVSFKKMTCGSAPNPEPGCRNGETRAIPRTLAYGTLAVVGP
jgi:hypothetical protein